MSQHVIVRSDRRPDPDAVATLEQVGVATAHEAMGRRGLTHPVLRPVYPGARIAGRAVTVLSQPGDNLMIHACIEQCGPGDVLVVTTTSPSTDGMFGELFATQLAARGVLGLVTRRLRAGHRQGLPRVGQRAGRRRRGLRAARGRRRRR